MNLKFQAKKFPLKPGVYRYLNSRGEILYIGRATVLRQRVLNYFQKNISPRIAEMISLAKTIEYETTETVLDAIILEANLIKKHWPKYNVKEKDDKSFSYLIITSEKFSKVLIVHGRELKNFPEPLAKFGPFQNTGLFKKALKIIRRIFPYSLCRPDSGKACFDYQIGQCPGVCVGMINSREYKKNIKNIILLFSGKKKRLIKKLMIDNPEQAVALSKINDTTLTVTDELVGSNFNRIEGYDISHFSGKEAYGSMVVFVNGTTDKSEYRLFKIKNHYQADDLRALAEVLTRRFNHPEWPQPDLIMIDGGRPQIDFMAEVFNKISVHVPFVGISKYQNDKLVFPKTANESFKKLAQVNKKILLQIRDEAHRFALKTSRRKRKI
ncbi:MAG: GIY-YIG nuclease family protein [Patescibacteria group bacterium]